MPKYIDDIIINSFYKLLKTKNVDDITVAELVEKAGINRKTFYNHFSGISDLICRIVLGKFSELIQSPSSSEGWVMNAKNLMYFLQNTSDFISQLFNSKYLPDVQRCLKQPLDNSIRNFIHSAKTELESASGQVYSISPAQENLIIRIYTPCIYALIEDWFLGGMKESIDDYIMIINKFLLGGLPECFRYFSELHE